MVIRSTAGGVASPRALTRARRSLVKIRYERPVRGWRRTLAPLRMGTKPISSSASIGKSPSSTRSSDE